MRGSFHYLPAVWRDTMRKSFKPRSGIELRYRKDMRLYHLMLFVPVLILFIYNILPIPAGILMSFQNFQPGKGFLGSKFVGLKNFQRLIALPDTLPALTNTLVIAVWKITGNLVSAVIFALLLNEIQVVGTPGAGFGKAGEGFFRLSSFGSREDTLQVMRQISRLIEN